MREEKITFILRVRSDFNSACRCINSIKRQTVGSYEIVGAVYEKETAEKLKKTYPEIEFSVTPENIDCRDKFNEIIYSSEAKYCMMVDSDSVIASDTVERILKYNEDLIIFGISKLNPAERFAPFNIIQPSMTADEYMELNQSIWAMAVRTDFITGKKIQFKGYGYENQALFLLLCLSLSSATVFDSANLVNKVSIPKKIPVSSVFYCKNRAEISRAMKAFKAKGDNKSCAQLIKHFLILEIEESYNRDILRKLKKMFALIKLIWF